MTELRLHRSLYRGDAVDEAIAKLAHLAEIERDEDATHWRVTVRAKQPRHEARIAAELGNFALGLTLTRGGPATE